MEWQIRESDLGQREPDFFSSVFAVGNGRVCTRGTLGEERFEAYRGVFVSGLYTRAPMGLMYFMGAPDWLVSFVTIGGEAAACRASYRVLDMRRGVLMRSARFANGSTAVDVEEERFASAAQPNLMAQRVTVRRVRGGERVDVTLGLDGEVRQSRAKYYRAGQFPNCEAAGLKLSRIEDLRADECLGVTLVSEPTGVRACAMARVEQTGGRSLGRPRMRAEDGRALAAWTLAEGDGEAYVFEKRCVVTGDLAGFERAVEDAAARFGPLTAAGYGAARSEHERTMEAFWRNADVVIDGDGKAQKAVRYALWATRIAAPSDGGASSVGAKNLTGDWYRGAVFWDLEIFQLPMLAAVAPERARNHVQYRIRRLPAARRLARQDGYRGARFPGQSYDTGVEDPPCLGGLGLMEIHVTLEAAWGMLHYYDLTGDADTMLAGGLETVLEAAAFWASRVTRDPDGTYHLRGICGPDELHKPVDDNAYTNGMIAELLRRADRLANDLSRTHARDVAAVLDRVGVDEAARCGWQDVAARLDVPMLDGERVEQYVGHRGVPEPNPALVKSQGMGADKVGKQADALMLFQNIPWTMKPSQLAPNYREYAPLCNQTSSLSLCTHALLAARLWRDRDARRYFDLAADVDLGDSMGNTCHGVHGAGQGGIWIAAVWGFGGLDVRPDGVTISPRLPPVWRGMEYRLILNGSPLLVRVGPGDFSVENRGARDVQVNVAGTPSGIKAGETRRFDWWAAWSTQGLEAVILDLDGVLVSTDRFHYQAWKELADGLGLPFDEERNHQLRGVSREESLRRIYGDRPLPSEAEFAAQCERKNRRYLEWVGRMTPRDVLPGAVELLEALGARGIRRAIVSASKNCGAVLERTGLGAYCDAWVDGHCVTAPKPDPQGFLVASQRLRVLPWNCVGVEDAEAGIESIRRAGMLAVGVGGQPLDADLTVAAVSDLTVDALQGLFARGLNPVNPYLERNIAIMKAEARGA